MLRERQLTFGCYGHTLNHRQAISPDGNWAVYDTRNDDSHIARTDAIEMVHLDSGEIIRLYKTANQTEFGPGVGAASFHPNQPIVAFIHGLENCSSEKPYSAARRFGAIVEINDPGKIAHAEARSVLNANGVGIRAFGALSGGTHAHSWSLDGWLSFTYNDAWLEGKSPFSGPFRNQRSVGFMAPNMPVCVDDRRVDVGEPESFRGAFSAFLAASLSAQARNGSDDIEAAVEECWVGANQRALAFLGAVRGESGDLVNEIFVCELPNENQWNEIAQRIGSATEMDANKLLEPVACCIQRRLTRTTHRTFPGVQGPRCWLVSSSDGKSLFAPMRDDRGMAQLCRINIMDGQVEQITDLEKSLDGQISLDRSGTQCSFNCDQRICLVDVPSGRVRWLTERSEASLVGAIHFAGENRFVFNRYVAADRESWLQIFIGEIE
jgi:Protein of unknown function (DUF3748)